MIFLPTIIVGQTKEIFLAVPFDKLVLEQTTLKQAEKILGKPTKRRVPPIIEHGWEKRIELDYAETKSTLRFGYKKKILYSFDLDSASPIIISNIIKIGIADTGLIIKTFGKPNEINEKPTYPYFYYIRKPYEVYFVFESNGILRGASFFRYSDADTIIPEAPTDTSKIFFGVNVKHIEDGLSNVTVNFASEHDTISIVTNKEGIADTLIPKRPYPKIIIKEKGYENYEMQITDKFIKDCNFVYKHINLISLADSVYKVKPCYLENLYSVDDSLLKEKIGTFSKPDKTPDFKGGLSEFQKSFAQNSLKHKYSFYFDYSVSIAFVVTCEGKAGNFQILTNGQGILETYENETLASIKKMSKFWQAATKDNKAVDCYQVLKFTVLKGKLKDITYIN